MRVTKIWIVKVHKEVSMVFKSDGKYDDLVTYSIIGSTDVE